MDITRHIIIHHIMVNQLMVIGPRIHIHPSTLPTILLLAQHIQDTTLRLPTINKKIIELIPVRRM